MRFWLGAQSKKGGRGQRNREEIGGGGSNEIFISLEASPLVREGFARDFMASPLSSAPDKTAMLRRLLTIHLHGETGNFGRKIKWSASSFGKLQKIWALI